MRDPRYSLFARRWPAPTSQSRADKGIRDWIAKNVDQTTAAEIRIQYGGSADAKNAPELSAFPAIAGVLVLVLLVVLAVDICASRFGLCPSLLLKIQANKAFLKEYEQEIIMQNLFKNKWEKSTGMTSHS